MPEINKDLLLDRILHSKELTALEKRYLESLIVRAMERKPEQAAADVQGKPAGQVQ